MSGLVFGRKLGEISRVPNIDSKSTWLHVDAHLFVFSLLI